MSVNNLGPLDWRIPIVTPEGRPTLEFQRRWATQIGNNSQIGGITIGSGPPPSVPTPADGDQYADTSTTPYTLYIANGGVWYQAGSSSGNPTAVASDVAVNGTAGTFMRSDAAPAVQKASSSQFGIVKVDGTTITESGGIISAVGGGGGGGGNDSWEGIAYDTISTPTAFKDYDVTNYDDVTILVSAVTTSSSGFRSVYVSTDGGATFYSASGDYFTIAANGSATATTSWGSHSTSTASGVTTVFTATGLRVNGYRKLGWSNGFEMRSFSASNAPITHLRVASTAGNMTGGLISVMGRKRVAGGLSMEPAWINGQGFERRPIIAISASGGSSGNVSNLLAALDTSTSAFYWSSGATTKTLLFTFPSANRVTGIGFVQSGTQANGTWTLEGSNDNISYTMIINNYVWGGTGYIPSGGAVSGNVYYREFTNAIQYKYYRLVLNSGQSTSSGPNILNMGFKCEPIT